MEALESRSNVTYDSKEMKKVKRPIIAQTSQDY